MIRCSINKRTWIRRVLSASIVSQVKRVLSNLHQNNKKCPMLYLLNLLCLEMLNRERVNARSQKHWHSGGGLRTWRKFENILTWTLIARALCHILSLIARSVVIVRSRAVLVRWRTFRVLMKSVQRTKTSCLTRKMTLLFFSKSSK